jgi:alpha-L-rhamnosidase
MGATTIWERWDSMLPDGSINPGEMTSFNHYALGAVADWLHRMVGGLAPAEPGYRTILIQPRPGGGIQHASARHVTPYGLAECRWMIDGEMASINVVVPPNAKAIVRLPGKEDQPFEVGSGRHSWSYPYRDPDVRKPISVDDPIGEIADVPQAWNAVGDVIARLAPKSHFIKFGLLTQRKTPLRQALANLPNAEDVLADISRALSRL